MTAVAQRSFAGGELAPSLYARTDMQKYAIGLRACRNMVVQRHGGVTNRPGTEFITEVKDSTMPVKMIKFERSRDEAYALEFGNLYVRMLRNGSYVQAVSTGAWAFPHIYFAGEVATSGGIHYVNLTEQNPNTVPALNPTDWYPLTGLTYELPTPYLMADLPEIRHAQRSGVMLSPGGLLRGKATILTLTHPDYAPRELSSRAEAIWYLYALSFVPAIGAPVGPIVFGGGAAGATRYWSITAVSDTGEESLVLTGSAINRIPSAATPTTLAWAAPAAGYPPVYAYRIYRSDDGASFGLIGTSGGGTPNFSDVGSVANMLSSPPGPRTIFDVADKYPTAVTHYQQRLMFGNTNTEQETIWGSRTGKFTNFSVSFPLQDDDGVTFPMVGKQLNAIQHLLDLGRLIAFTSNEEKIVEGDQAGILRPDAINPRKLSAHGSSTLRPIEIDDSAIYVQGRGTIVRDLKPISADSYQGTDLTVWAAHLFNGYGLVDWDYAESPHSIVWAPRSDGTLLGLTYLREHDVYGWHRHDTDGVVENVCVIPEGSEDKVYLVVRRTINGTTKRYIERMAARYYSPSRPQDAHFVDCGTIYDGAPTATVTGLSHLEGKTVAVYADGYVIASPNNTDAGYPTIVVSGGQITLPDAYSVIHVGLPYISDMEPLDLDLPGGATIKDKKLLVNEVGLYVERSRGVWIGDPDGPTVADPLSGLREWKARSDEAYASPVAERTDFFKVKIRNEWGPGRFLVRQVDPLPLTILSATPIGYLPQ